MDKNKEYNKEYKLTKEYNKEYKLTKEKILTMADECEDVKKVLRRAFPDVFGNVLVDVTGNCFVKEFGDSNIEIKHKGKSLLRFSESENYKYDVYMSYNSPGDTYCLKLTIYEKQ